RARPDPHHPPRLARPELLHARRAARDQGDPRPARTHRRPRAAAGGDVKRLALVFAHPDDDSFGVSGSVALHRDDVEVQVILATSGEAGMIADPSLATRENLGEVREEESRASYRALGVKPEHHFLRYPDGGLK